VRSQNLLSYPRSDIEETPCSLDNLLVEEMFINEGLYPATLEGQVESEILLPPDLNNTTALSQQGLFLMFSLLCTAVL